MKLKAISFITLLMLISTTSAKTHKKNKHKSSSSKRIIDGVKVSIADYKYYVPILNAKNVFCGGALVTKNKIITAGHCAGAEPIKAYPGAETFSDIITGKVTAYETKSVFIHKDYETKHYKNDMAILYLKNDVKLGGNISTVEVAPKLPPVGAKITLVGHGVTSCKTVKDGYCDEPVSEYLMKTDMEIIEIDDPQIYCKMSPNRPCEGDSGGPFTYKGQLVAVVSHSSDQNCKGRRHAECSTSGPVMLKFLADHGIYPAKK